jgi:hypothetical protein
MKAAIRGRRPKVSIQCKLLASTTASRTHGIPDIESKVDQKVMPDQGAASVDDALPGSLGCVSLHV